MSDPTGTEERLEPAGLHALAKKLQDIESKKNAMAAVLAASVEERSNGFMYRLGIRLKRSIYSGAPLEL